MAIAEHDPAALYSENKGLAKMSKKQLHDFASTPEGGLPDRAGDKVDVRQLVKKKKS